MGKKLLFLVLNARIGIIEKGEKMEKIKITKEQARRVQINIFMCDTPLSIMANWFNVSVEELKEGLDFYGIKY